MNVKENIAKITEDVDHKMVPEGRSGSVSTRAGACPETRWL